MRTGIYLSLPVLLVGTELGCGAMRYGQRTYGVCKTHQAHTNTPDSLGDSNMVGMTTNAIVVKCENLKQDI